MGLLASDRKVGSTFRSDAPSLLLARRSIRKTGSSFPSDALVVLFSSEPRKYSHGWQQSTVGCVDASTAERPLLFNIKGARPCCDPDCDDLPGEGAVG